VCGNSQKPRKPRGTSSIMESILNLCFLLSILASLRPCVLKGRSTGSPEILVTQGRLPLRTIRGRFFRRRAASYL
jgi:hypothetical protein